MLNGPTPRSLQRTALGVGLGTCHTTASFIRKSLVSCTAQYSGISLSQSLYYGPNLVNNLLSVFTRFWQRAIGPRVDTVVMFHQVIVPPRDLDAPYSDHKVTEELNQKLIG